MSEYFVLATPETQTSSVDRLGKYSTNTAKMTIGIVIGIFQARYIGESVGMCESVISLGLWVHTIT